MAIMAVFKTVFGFLFRLFKFGFLFKLGFYSKAC